MMITPRSEYDDDFVMNEMTDAISNIALGGGTDLPCTTIAFY